MVIAAVRKHIGLKAVGMTGEYWKTCKIAKAEREQAELRERLGIHSKEYRAKDREVWNLERFMIRDLGAEGDYGKGKERDVVNPE